MNKKILALITGAALASAGLTVFANSPFKDVTANYWASQTINWGATKGIIHGYEDGTFRPNNQVTEAEFLTMLINSFGPAPQKSDTYWASGYYSYAKKMNWPTMGSDNQTARDWKINRQRVAELVSGASGVNYTGDNAVKYLLGKGLATGKNPGDISVGSYKPQDELTRAEAIQFIKNLKDKGLGELKARPAQPSDPAQIPTMPKPQPKPIPNPVPQTKQDTPVVHKITQNEIDNADLGTKLATKMKSVASPETDASVQAFINSVHYENGMIIGKVPSVPKGYSTQMVYDGGVVVVKPGDVVKQPIKAQVFGFGVMKYGQLTVNGVTFLPSTGQYWWQTK